VHTEFTRIPKFRGYRTAWIYTSAYPRVVFRNAETCINPPMGFTADALACGSLWTCNYENAKFHFSVDPHHSRFAGIRVTRRLGDLRYYRHA